METEAASIIIEGFRMLHHSLRTALESLSEEDLNRRPGEDSNSIAVIITHVLGSERETLSAVAGLETERDRDSEFQVRGVTRDHLIARLNAADELLDRVSPLLTEERLNAHVRLPTLVGRLTEPSGIERLIYNYGHAREHLGEMSITREVLSEE